MQRQGRHLERSGSKRALNHSGGGGDDDDELAPKRPRVPALASVIVEVLKVDSLQKLCSSLEPILRRVSEEVERALVKLGPAGPPRIQGSSPECIEGRDGRNLQLKFRIRLSLPLFTGGKVEGGQGAAIHVVLLDANTEHVTTSGPESFAKLDILVLEGDYNKDEHEGWTEEDFENHIVKEREGKRPLLTGDLQVTLKEGVGTIGELIFTDNSSWIRSRKFRLGLRVSSGFCEGIRIMESKTEAFTVKDHRGERMFIYCHRGVSLVYKKHYPPALKDDVWSLEKIGKDGAFHKKLNSNGIYTVEHFLQLPFRDQQKLRSILGSNMSNRMWESLVEHVKTCVLSGKHYIYYSRNAQTVGAIFNNIYEFTGLIADDQFISAENLTENQRMLKHLGFGKKGKKNSGSSSSTSQTSTGSEQSGLFQGTTQSTRRRRRELLEYVAEQGGGSAAGPRVETRVLDRCPTYELYGEETVQGRGFEQGGGLEQGGGFEHGGGLEQRGGFEHRGGLEQGGGSARGSRVEVLEQSPSSKGGTKGDDENEEEVDDSERDARLARAAELAELGRPDRCPFRLRRHLLCNPARSIDERTIIKPKGTRCWIEPGWSGKGHRRVINTELGNAIRFCFPGMVLAEGQRKAAHSWDHYALKPYGRGTCQDKVWEIFWGSFRLEEGTSEAYTSFVFQNAARRRTKDSFSDARIKAVTVYYKTVLLQPMTNKDAAKIHLDKEEYLQSSVDWICVDMEAWQWLCEYWASDEFKNKSNRNRRNRKSKPGKHFYGPDGYVRMEQRMTAETGAPPTFFELYLKGHRGRDPNHPEQLCDEASTQKLAKYVECFKKTHEDDADYVREPLDVAAAYEAGGGLPHGRLGLGDGYVEREACARRRSPSVSSSRSESNTKRELRQELRRNKEEMHEIRQMNMQMQQQMAYMLQLFPQGGIGSQFGAPRTPFASSSQGSESCQRYISPAQRFLSMLGATPPAWSPYPYPPYPGFLPPPAGPVHEPSATHAVAGSHQVTPEGCDDFLNLNDNMGASGGGASGGNSHNMRAD